VVITIGFKILDFINLPLDPRSIIGAGVRGIESIIDPMLESPFIRFSINIGLIASVFLFWCTEASGSEADHCGVNGVALQILGSGGPELQDQRASSAYLLWWNGQARVLVDIGGGAALRFGQSGANVAGLDVILLTHLHIDHVGDLPALVKSSYFEDRHDVLPVYGPTGNANFPATTSFVRELFASPHGAFRYLSRFVTPKEQGSYLLQAHDIVLKPHEVRLIVNRNGIQVVAATVIHGDVPALAYRVEFGGVRIAFSGDTDGNNGNLQHLADNADVLVAHNAVPEGAQGVERALHMPPSVIGRIARDAGVRRVILSHRMLRTLGREEETTIAIRESFPGPITFANDLDCFPIS
jgi:ribonuclease BN (tRNA processing enzyme)